MDDNDYASTRIRDLRQKVGMTQEEFAQEITVTVSTVNRWENGHSDPSKLAWRAIRELARTRGIDAASVQPSSRAARRRVDIRGAREQRRVTCPEHGEVDLILVRDPVSGRFAEVERCSAFGAGTVTCSRDCLRDLNARAAVG